jgi:hypothetical protein
MIANVGKVGVVHADVLGSIFEESRQTWLGLGRIDSLPPEADERLKLYDRLGNLDWHFYVGFARQHSAVPLDPAERDARMLEGAFLKDPTRTSLLPAMRAFAQELLIEIPIAVLRGVKPATESQRTSLAILSSSQPDLDESSADWVSSLLCEAAGTEDVVPEALRVARSWVESEKALAVLATSLLDHLPESAWVARAAAFDTLDDVLRRRKSDLRSLASSEADQWLREEVAR